MATCAPGCAIGCNQYTSLSLDSSRASDRSCLVPKEYSVGARQPKMPAARCPQMPQPPRVLHQQASTPFGWGCGECTQPPSSALTPDYQNQADLISPDAPVAEAQSASQASAPGPGHEPSSSPARQCCPMRSACGDYFWSCTADLSPASGSARDRDLSELRLTVSEPTPEPDATVEVSWTLVNRSEAPAARVRLYELDIRIWHANEPSGELSAPWNLLTLVRRFRYYYVRVHCTEYLFSTYHILYVLYARFCTLRFSSFQFSSLLFSSRFLCGVCSL